MIGLVRLTVIVFVTLTFIYLLVSWYSRSVRREKLERRAEERIAEGRLAPDGRDAFIRKGMHAYDRSLRKKLILGVYVVPIVLIVTLIVVTNFL